MTPEQVVRRRIYHLLGLAGAVCLGLVIQLARVQFGPYAPVFEARSHYPLGQVVQISPARGLIYDRDGVLLAANAPRYYLEGELRQLMEGLEGQVEECTAELKTAHEQLVRTEKLSSLGKLSASIAHEINNPLAGILTFAKLVSRALAEGPPDAARRAGRRAAGPSWSTRRSPMS